MLAFQYHVRPLLKHIHDIVFTILAAQTQQKALVFPIQQELLQETIWPGKLDSQGPVFSAYPFPERIVAIEHSHFERLAFLSVQGSEYCRRNRRITIQCVWDMPGLIVRVIIVIGHGIEFRQT